MCNVTILLYDAPGYVGGLASIYTAHSVCDRKHIEGWSWHILLPLWAINKMPFRPFSNIHFSLICAWLTRFEHEQAKQSFHAFMQSVTYHLLADPAPRRDAFSIYLLLLSQNSNVNSRAPPIYEDDTSRASRYWHVLTAFVFFKSSHTSSSGA